MGALQYTTAAYKKEEYASLEHKNLGGLRLDIGGAVKLQKRIRGFLHLGYLIDQEVSYTVSDDSRDTDDVVRTQRPPLAKGEKVKMTQGGWEIVAGGGYSF